MPNLDAFKALAASTGGRAFFNRNDIKSAIRAAVDDGRVTYVIAYYPSHGKWDGAFRRITVKVNRPDLEVRHRAGYRAFPIPAKPPTRETGRRPARGVAQPNRLDRHRVDRAGRAW